MRWWICILCALVCYWHSIFADQWRIWNSQNSPLPTDTITAVVETPEGELWIGTPRGLLHYYAQLWTRYTPANSGLPDSLITALALDAQHRLWIGTPAGVAVLEQSQWQQYTSQNSGLGNDHIRAIAPAPDGSIWFATAGGVFRWHLQQWRSYTTQNSNLPSNNVQTIAVAPNGDVWIGTENAGIAVFHQQRWKQYGMHNSPLPSNVVLALLATTEAIWIATWGNGLVKLSLPDSTWHIYTTANSPLPHDWIRAIAADHCGTLWLGTRAGGLAMTNGRSWEIWQPNNSPLPDYFVRALFTRSPARIWIGTNRGLVLFQPAPQILLSLESIILDCHDPTLRGMLTTRGEFTSSNLFIFLLHQADRIDTLRQIPAQCSLPFAFPLQNVLEHPQFQLEIVSTAPPVSALSDTLRTTMPIPTIDGDSTMCEGDTVYLSVREPFAHYRWSTGDTTFRVQITQGGTYTVTVTDSSGCSTTRSFTVTAFPRPDIRASADTSICEGEPAFLSVEGGIQYLWEPAESLNDPTSPTPIAFPTETTTYVVRGINEYGCASTDTVTITVRPAPPPPQITQRGDTLFASPATSYQWYRNNTPIAGATQQFLVVTQNGKYKVRITDSTGCSAFSEEIEITVNSVPSLPAFDGIPLFVEDEELIFSIPTAPFRFALYTLDGRLVEAGQSFSTTYRLRLSTSQPTLLLLICQTTTRLFRSLVWIP